MQIGQSVIMQIDNNVRFRKYIDIALSLHEKDSSNRCQHTAVITYKNRIVSIGRNSRKTSPFNLYNPKIGTIDGRDITRMAGVCAESAAIKKLRNTTNIPFHKTKMFVIRIDNNRKVANSKLCYSCASLARHFEIGEIFYTNKDGNWEKFI